MPLELALPADPTAISLEEFVECVAAERYDFSAQDDLVDAARYLQRLNNNKSFVLDRMFAELGSLDGFQRANLYGPQVFLLHVAETYFLRANVWRPLSVVEKSIRNFQYDVCHDHNFDILTAGYFGPGYACRSYTYDRSSVVGLLGEQANLVPHEDFFLWEGRMALYRAKRDVHIQMAPSAMSVSLNLIPNNQSLREAQFQFDESSGRIVRYLQASGSELAVRLAGVLGNETHLELLERIAKTNPSPHLRALAKVSEIQLSGSNFDPASEESPLIRDLIMRELNAYGDCLQLHSMQSS